MKFMPLAGGGGMLLGWVLYFDGRLLIVSFNSCLMSIAGNQRR